MLLEKDNNNNLTIFGHKYNNISLTLSSLLEYRILLEWLIHNHYY